MKGFKNSKSVFLITIDALRPDHLKFYGYPKDVAPNLTDFAKRATIFTNAFTNGPETPASFSTIFTSSLPLIDGGFCPLPLQKLYLPQILKENDIFCYGIHSNPNLSAMFNYNRGFDVFLDGERYKSSNEKQMSLKKSVILLIRKMINYKDLIEKIMYRLVGFNKVKSFFRQNFPKITDMLLPFTPMAYNAPYLTNRIISFLKHHEGPLFLWAHFMDVHSPYNPPKRNLINVRGSELSPSRLSYVINDVYLNPHEFEITEDILNDLKDLYDGEINFVDENLGILLDYITKRYKKDCLVMILADHGESFFEHGFFNHQGNVYEELLKVPLIVKISGHKRKERMVTEIVQLIDIAPTILDYFNIIIPEVYSGQSLLPLLLRGEKIKKESLVITESYQKSGKMKKNNEEGFKIISIRTDTWKFIYDEESEMKYLFNIKKDPEEHTNLIDQEVKITEEFRKQLADHLKKIEEIDEKSKLSSVIQKLDLSKL
jgi:arylsulfatase A-like enzyme